jgi:hypothetical protein
MQDNKYEFTYMMLGRLKSDNDYFLGYGNRNEGSIWGNSVDSHIAEMKRLWNTLPEDGKPEWLSMEDILEYEKEMKKQYPEVGDKVIITTDSLGEKYKGMSGTINDRKLINDKYSIKLEDGMEMAFSKDEFRHNSINPRYENGGTVTKEEIDDFVYEYLTSREEAEETLKRRKARLSNEENQRLYELNKKSLNNELTNSEEIEFDKLVHKYRGWEYSNGGGVAKELNGYRVRIYKSGNDTSSQNVVSSKFDNIILVTDGIKGDSFSVMSNEPYIKLVKRNLFGKEVLSAEPVNFGVDNNHKMFGGTFVWSSDSRFRDDISKQPIPLHDRVEVYENGGVFVSPHVNDLHNYIIASYGFLLPKEDESGYDKFTYSDFAEQLKSTYDIKNPRNKQVYDYLIHLGNIPMFSGKVSDMKKIEERMSTANIKFDNGGINDNITNKAKHEIDFLTKKGYDIDAYSTLNRDVIFGGEKIDDFIIATQGSIGKGKDTKFAIAYWYRDNEDGEMQISRNLLDEISNLFKGNPVILYTNAGVDLHSITEGKHNNIQVIKVAYGEFSGNSDEFKEGGHLKKYTSSDLPKDGSEIKIFMPEMGNFPAEDIVLKYNKDNFSFDAYRNRELSATRITERQILDNLDNGLYKFKEVKEKYSKGGGINNGRDLLFKSKEPHEQKYNRKRGFKKYNNKESWFNDLFEEGGNVGYGSIKKEKQRMTDELFKKCGVFFAFSNEQFAKNKTPLKEGEKYISIGAGGYMPKGNYDAFVEGLKEIKKFGKKKVEENNLAETEILYELNNHESFYTGDYSDVVDMFKGTYTEEQIRNVYNKHIGSQFEQGGNVKYSVTAYLGEVISIDTAEMALGRKINLWKDDVITIDGTIYKKVFLKPEYKQVFKI